MNENDRELLSKGAEASGFGFKCLIIKALCRVALDQDERVSVSGGRTDFNEASIQAMQAAGNLLDEMHSEQSIKEDKKPMKATVIISTMEGMGMGHPFKEISHITAEIKDPSKLIEVCQLATTKASGKILYIHYDGMLFEYTSKPALAEVGTGIEI